MGQGWMTIVLGLCTLVAGCAPPGPPGGPAGVGELRVSMEPGAPVGQVLLTLVNRSGRELGYNLCVAALDRRDDGEWVEWPEPPAEACTMELRVLAPGDSATFRHTLPGGLPAGEYRFRTGVEAPLGEGRLELASGPFRVRG